MIDSKNCLDSLFTIFDCLFRKFPVDSSLCLKCLPCLSRFLLQEDAANRNLALTGEDMFSLWSKKRTRRSLYRNMSALCCTCKPAYL